jgi:diaminopimelate epimerase
VKLAKWQGLGNNYLIVENSALPEELTEQAIGLLCDRHLGVGADGILLLEPPTGAVPEAVARMRVFNPDGSEPEMCGNGIRMFACYLARSGVVADREFTVETLAGPIRPRLLDDRTVRVDMGIARFNGPGVQSAQPGGADVVAQTLEAGGQTYRFTFVDVGNPHCVILVHDPSGFSVTTVGPLVERHPLFPNRANVEFVRVEGDGSASMRVWERGVGETLACGTGATAVGAALVRLGLASSPVLVHLSGGDLTIEVESILRGTEAATGSHAAGPSTPGVGEPFAPRVFMTGPAEEVFTCELSPDLLARLGWLSAVGESAAAKTTDAGERSPTTDD